MVDDPIRRQANDNIRNEKHVSNLPASLSEIEVLKSLYAAESDPEERAKILQHAIERWHLISAEIGEWIFACFNDLGGFHVESSIDTGLASDRRNLLSLLITQEHYYKMDSADFDPVSIILPRKWLFELLDALMALNHNDVLSMLKPRGTGEHGTYSRRKARTLCVEHVCFLVGTGKTKLNARKLVAQATHISTETVRKWERDVDPERKKMALAAGKLSSERSSENPPNPAVLRKMKQLQQEDDLASFGKYFHEKFSGQHWGGGTN